MTEIKGIRVGKKTWGSILFHPKKSLLSNGSYETFGTSLASPSRFTLFSE
jgi:hypothetical protein